VLQVFNDDDVREHVDAPTAVRAVRSALLAHHDGTLVAPARVRAGLGDGDLVFTAGHLRRQGLFGFRAYDTFAGAEQLVAVWDARSGALRAVVHGAELGVRRTGAIGAVAVDAAATPGPVRLGLVGAGVQAWAQLWAVRAVRPVVSVTVASRHLERAQEFARRATRELGVDARAVSRAEEAVRDHDVVIVATTSTAPVLEADWIAPGTHVSTLGPKSATHHEVPPALCDRTQPRHRRARIAFRRPLPPPDRRRPRPHAPPARRRLGAAEPGGVQRHRRRVPPGPTTRNHRGGGP
jgi:alanine dehydrogenase